MMTEDHQRVLLLLSDMLEGLYRALPVIEDAEDDPHYRQGYIKALRIEIVDLIERAERE
tara:strand:- start:10399 stop:10575 length:177 start_codon:yes stop_codon:yes gene_type:complete